MKPSLLVLIILFSLSFSNAQKQTTASQESVKFFIENYNTGNFEEIYHAFSTQMQRNFPLKKTIQFFSNLKKESGKIYDYKFTGYLNDGSWASYNTSFENGKFQLKISSDNFSKIKGFLIKPLLEKK